MKTSVNRARTFEHLFSIPREILQRDLASPHGFIERFRQEPGSDIFARADRPQQDALLIHGVLLLAYAIQELKNSKVEDYLYMGADAASEIANEATIAAMEKGRLRQLRRTLDQIKIREGRPYPLGWPRGAGPTDYEAAASEFRTLLFNIHATVKIEILTRYRLTSILEVYHNDISRFHELAHKGRTGSQLPAEKTQPRVNVQGIIKLPASRLLTMLEHLDRAEEHRVLPGTELKAPASCI